jgi:carboxypeptidase C (cathepsin A)
VGIELCVVAPGTLQTSGSKDLTMLSRRLAYAICLILLTAGLLWAAGMPPSEDQLPTTDDPFVTQHEIKTDGNVLHYTARTGFISLRDEFNQVHGRIFYVTYQLDRGTSKTPRPLTFAWNGGPGSPSSMLQLGALGPFRVKDLSEYPTPPPPYELTENESTWLDQTDLVFVDPVGTGYSYALSEQFAKEFWSPKGDIDSVAEFIRLFLAKYEYSPKTPIFLIGESYGTFRAAGVADKLQQRDIRVSGVVLISTVLEVGQSEGSPDLRYIRLIPSYTVAAFVHKKLPSDLQADLEAAIQRSEDWAESQYSVALLKGDRLSQEDRQRVTREYSRFTGLDEDFVAKHNLRVDMEEFANHLLKDQKLVLGHYDVRASASTTSTGGEYDPTHDPSLNSRGTGKLIVPYLETQLGFKSTALYAGPFGGRWPSPTQHRGDWMSVRWDWGSAKSSDADQGPALARALRENKSMQVLVISGLYDLATPFFGVEGEFAHLGLEPAARSRIVLESYEGGHMVYLDAANRKRLKRDFASLVQRALSAPSASSE